MNGYLRKQIMYNGVIGFGKNPNKLELKDGNYLICNRMKNLIRIKNIVLFLEVFAGTFIYRYILDRDFNMLAKDATNNDFKNGIIITFIFMALVGILVYLTPRLIIPKDLGGFNIRKVED
ncbi:hypothetical protein [Anaerosalibacter bizertensis]|uniref:hypothetical protein n=1 Tax=Anaerosalibacter bizertensis TaxID=932217 RepID=UPI0035186747